MVEKGVLYEKPFLGECEVCIQIILYVKLEGMVEIIFMQGLFIIVSIEGLSLSNSIGIVLLDCDCGKRFYLFFLSSRHVSRSVQVGLNRMINLPNTQLVPAKARKTLIFFFTQN